MKATGIIRRVDDLGRVIIPKEIRRSCNIREGDPLEIFVENGCVCFSKYQPDIPRKIFDGFNELKNYASEWGRPEQKQQVENLRKMVEEEIDKIFKN